MYVQTEATFLSRQYDQSGSSFNLLNSAEFVPGGTYTDHVVSPADDRLVGLDWINIPVPALTSELGSSDQTADMMTGSPRISLGVVGSVGEGDGVCKDDIGGSKILSVRSGRWSILIEQIPKRGAKGH